MNLFVVNHERLFWRSKRSLIRQLHIDPFVSCSTGHLYALPKPLPLHLKEPAYIIVLHRPLACPRNPFRLTQYPVVAGSYLTGIYHMLKLEVTHQKRFQKFSHITLNNISLSKKTSSGIPIHVKHGFTYTLSDKSTYGSFSLDYETLEYECRH